MVNKGFIVEDDEDETQTLKNKYNYLRRPELYHMMILPTYQCNLRCWYCIQGHSDSWMSKETIAKVKRLVRQKLVDQNISAFRLSWFGGEPLLNYPVVLELTTFCKSECKKAGKEFSSGITTNSTLLAPKRIEELRDAGIIDYQITIDGTREVHDKVKVLGSLSAYDVAINNINEIAKHTHVNLRFNYTAKNLDPEGIIRQLKDSLNKEILNNVSFNLFKVWQEGDDAIDVRKVDRLFLLGNQMGLRTNLFHTNFCYVDQHRFDCIFPNSKVGKCDNLSPDEVYGTLTDKGTIEWDNENVKYAEPVLFSGVVEYECETCQYLPFCWGPCSVKREYMWRNNNRISCQFVDKHSQLKQYILNYIHNREIVIAK